MEYTARFNAIKITVADPKAFGIGRPIQINGEWMLVMARDDERRELTLERGEGAWLRNQD